jgi:hypothetical protein
VNWSKAGPLIIAKRIPDLAANVRANSVLPKQKQRQ